MSNTPVLYIFVRTELPSMTPGKAQAHSGHAANAFIYEQFVRAKSKQQDSLVNDWMNQTNQGFGTQINLLATWDQIDAAVTEAAQLGFAANLVTDPTYPYEVDTEIFKLLPEELHTAPPVFKENGRVICFRKEQTAAYIFGEKEDLASIVGMFPLHP